MLSEVFQSLHAQPGESLRRQAWRLRSRLGRPNPTKAILPVHPGTVIEEYEVDEGEDTDVEVTGGAA